MIRTAEIGQWKKRREINGVEFSTQEKITRIRDGACTVDQREREGGDGADGPCGSA